MSSSLILYQSFTICTTKLDKVAGIQAAHTVLVYQFSLYKYGFSVEGALCEAYLGRSAPRLRLILLLYFIIQEDFATVTTGFNLIVSFLQRYVPMQTGCREILTIPFLPPLRCAVDE